MIRFRGKVAAVEIKTGTVQARQLIDLEELKITELEQAFAVSLASDPDKSPTVKPGWKLVPPARLLRELENIF